jgi:hypothetical protein
VSRNPEFRRDGGMGGLLRFRPGGDAVNHRSTQGAKQ